MGFHRTFIWGAYVTGLFAFLDVCTCAPMVETGDAASDGAMAAVMSVALFVVLAVGIFCCGSSSRTVPQAQVVVTTGPGGVQVQSVVSPIADPLPLWASGVSIIGDAGVYGWDQGKMSSRLTLVDPFTIMKTSPEKASDGAMTKAEFKKGKHIFEVNWPKAHRGAFATIGVARASMPLENPKPMTLVGSSSKSWALDLVRKKAYHLGKPIAIVSYPAAALNVEIPDTFTMYLDADAGTVAFGQVTGTWGQCFSYKYANDEPVRVMVGVTHATAAVKLFYKGSSGSGAENAGSEVHSTVVGASGPAGTVAVAQVVQPMTNYGKTHVTGQPLWISDLGAPDQNYAGWGERDGALNPLFNPLDGERILYMAPNNKYTAGARLKLPMKTGKYVFAVNWPLAMRGRYSTIGIGTAAHPLQMNEANSLVGSTSAGYGLDIVTRKPVRKNDKSAKGYPRGKIPDQFYMYVDMDVGTLAFGTELEYWDTLFTGINRGEDYYVMVGMTHSMAMVGINYIGCSREMQATVEVQQVPLAGQIVLQPAVMAQPQPVAQVHQQTMPVQEAPPAYQPTEQHVQPTTVEGTEQEKAEATVTASAPAE